MSKRTLPLADIKIGARHRKDLGNIDTLAASIAELGLLQPIVVRPDGELIAGERRLKAVATLKWSNVPVHVVDIDAIARGELAENALRKDFTPSEMVAISATVEKREHELAKQRMTLGKVSTGSEAGKTRDRVAAPLGVSGRTLEKAKAVVAAAEEEPERFGKLLAEMDRTGKVNAAHRALRRTEDEKDSQPRAGHGQVQDACHRSAMAIRRELLGRGNPDYNTMTLEELLALPVKSWAEENCHLYLWTTNAIQPKAFELMKAWPFTYNTMLTWAKPKFGMGTHFRGQTEHVLFGIRGTLATRVANISTLFEAPVGKHSEKPEKFYEIVRAASYPPYGEAFQREARSDFQNLFAGPEVCPNGHPAAIPISDEEALDTKKWRKK